MRIWNSGGHQRPDPGVVVVVVRSNPSPTEPTRRNIILQRHHHHPSNLHMPPSFPPSPTSSPWTGGSNSCRHAVNKNLSPIGNLQGLLPSQQGAHPSSLRCTAHWPASASRRCNAQDVSLGRAEMRRSRVGANNRPLPVNPVPSSRTFLTPTPPPLPTPSPCPFCPSKTSALWGFKDFLSHSPTSPSAPCHPMGGREAVAASQWLRSRRLTN